MVDMGIRNHILPRKRYDLGFTIENIVYLELSRRGGKVNIGKYGSTEVDFVTQKEGVLTYYQVTADMTAEETFEREMRPLRSIQDNYEKIVLTLDRFFARKLRRHKSYECHRLAFGMRNLHLGLYTPNQEVPKHSGSLFHSTRATTEKKKILEEEFGVAMNEELEERCLLCATLVKA